MGAQTPGVWCEDCPRRGDHVCYSMQSQYYWNLRCSPSDERNRQRLATLDYGGGDDDGEDGDDVLSHHGHHRWFSSCAFPCSWNLEMIWLISYLQRYLYSWKMRWNCYQMGHLALEADSDQEMEVHHDKGACVALPCTDRKDGSLDLGQDHRGACLPYLKEEDHMDHWVLRMGLLDEA